MKHDREFWTRHVEGWRASGLTRQMYCRRHHLTKSALGYWVTALKRSAAKKSDLVEVGRAPIIEKQPSAPIELIVGGRYVLRLWAGMEPAHMRDVLSVLECRP